MPLSLRFALRELRSGVAGFRVFLACLALGVAALAAAGSTAEAFRRGLAAQSREILGGDLALTVQGRRFTPEERAAFAQLGRTTDVVRIRAMAEAPSGLRRLVETRGVDPAYPLAGRVELQGAPALAPALAEVAGVPGAAVERALLDRLGLRLGGRFLIGDAPFVVRAVLAREPDRLAGGFALGPRVLVSRAALERAGLTEADSQFVETIRIAFATPREPGPVVKALRTRFPDARMLIRTRAEAASGLKRLIDQLEYFLGFIGLSSLLAGGLGVASAVSAYLEARKPSIAVLKALGAEAALARNAYLIQIGALATLGIAIGLGVGAASPLLLAELARGRLPVPALFAVYPEPLARAAEFGVLAAAAFSLLPLARARATPPAALFRRELSGGLGFGLETAGVVVAALGLLALTVATAPTRLTAAAMVGAVAIGFALLWALGWAGASAAGRLRTRATGALRLGLANLAGPRSAARTASPAIGLGVALLTCVVLIQSSLLAQVRDVAPTTAPSLVLTQIPGERAPEVDAVLRSVIGPLTPGRYRRLPFATGRIVRLKGAPVDMAKIAREQRWAFDQDLTLGLVERAPPDANVVAGRWWPAGYSGPPLVMIDRQVADGAGLRPGDGLTVSLLGRELETRIAGLRWVEWGGFGTSFAVVMSPSALEGAGLRHIAIVKASAAQEAAILRALGRTVPEVNVISVREQLEAAGRLFDQLAWAVRGAAGVAALAGLLVLVGALAADARTREKEAAILRVLGAARAQVLAAYAVEYLAVGLLAGVIGAGLGAAAAWPVVVLVFKARWSLDWGGLLAILAGVAAVTLAGGVLAAVAALSRRPAPVLRAD